MKLFLSLFNAILFSVLFSIVNTGEAVALSADVRTSDWVLQQTSLWGVLYWSDYNGAYGTNYYTITVGM